MDSEPSGPKMPGDRVPPFADEEPQEWPPGTGRSGGRPVLRRAGRPRQALSPRRHFLSEGACGGATLSSARPAAKPHVESHSASLSNGYLVHVPPLRSHHPFPRPVLATGRSPPPSPLPRLRPTPAVPITTTQLTEGSFARCPPWARPVRCLYSPQVPELCSHQA